MITRRTILIAAAAPFLLAAQEPERKAIPFSNPSAPKKVHIESVRADVRVRVHAGNDVVVLTDPSKTVARPKRTHPKELEGLQRVDLGGDAVSVSETENVVSIRLSPMAGSNVDVQIPANTSVRVRTLSGDVAVEGVHGEIELNSMAGNVTATGVQGSVVAHALNGNVVIDFDRADPKPMSFSTLNGNIDVKLPASTKARLKIKAERGELYTDFKLENSPGGEGREGDKMRPGRAFSSAINGGGGAEISFTTMNGEIRLRRKP